MNKKLIQYLKEEVLTKYNQLDGSHSIDHILNVVSFSEKLWEKYFSDKIKYELIITAAIYHDLGRLVDDSTHEIISCKMVKEDRKLKEYLTNEEIDLIADAVLNHRASNGKPKTLLAKIIADADHSEIDIDRMITRSYNYTKSKFPELDEVKIYNKVYSHLKEKYSDLGYSKLVLEESEEELKDAKLTTINLLNDENLFKKYYFNIIK